MMARREKLTVVAGRSDATHSRRDEESGETYHVTVRGYGITFTTFYGEEYNHDHQFPPTVPGLQAAERLATRVQTLLDTVGVDGLDMTHWNVRTIYGTQAYLDQEPEIVQREKDDALLNEAFG
jgi:hypothetical protein